MSPTIAAPKNYSPRQRAGKHRVTRPRTLNIVDLENLVAGHVTKATVKTAWNEYCYVTGLREGDQSFIAVAERHAATAFFALPPGIKRLVGDNVPDGADVVLLSAVDDPAWVARNYGQVMIASGDHIFAPLAQRFLDVGVPVVQVLGGGACATNLYRRCSTQLYLPQTREKALVRRRKNVLRELRSTP